MRDKIDVRESNTRLFTLIAIETGSKCNRTCSFCPVSHAPREDEWMSDEMIDKIISDLVALNYRDRIYLYSYNEPMRDPRLCDIIRKVRERLPRVCMGINTNGDYIGDVDDLKRPFLAGLNQMQINVYSSADGSGDEERVARGIEKAEKRRAFLQGLVDSVSWLDQRESLYQKIPPSHTACQVVPKYGFQPQLEDHDNHQPHAKHGISKRHHLANRAGNIPEFMSPLTEPYSKMCIRPFRTITINWRGDAFLCCNAYTRSDSPSQAAFGNVMDKSVEQLWNDERFHAYRIKLQNKDRRIYLCDKCDYDGGFYQHNVQHVTLGAERDADIVAADMRDPSALGWEQDKPLVKIRRRTAEHE